MALRRATLGIVLLAGCALPVQSQARVSAHHMAKLRAALTRRVQRDPSVVMRAWFLRTAGLAQFKLPGTLRLGSPPVPTAHVDLGAALGTRTVVLGGSLAAEVIFSDSGGGAALGNVGLEILPSDTKFLRTSSIPLLFNEDASATTGLSPAGLAQGCGDFTAAGYD